MPRETMKEYAARVGVTVETLLRWESEWVMSEGYDDRGNEYETLGEWWAMKLASRFPRPADRGGVLGIGGNSERDMDTMSDPIEDTQAWLFGGSR